MSNDWRLVLVHISSHWSGQCAEGGDCFSPLWVYVHSESVSQSNEDPGTESPLTAADGVSGRGDSADERSDVSDRHGSVLTVGAGYQTAIVVAVVLGKVWLIGKNNMSWYLFRSTLPHTRTLKLVQVRPISFLYLYL